MQSKVCVSVSQKKRFFPKNFSPQYFFCFENVCMILECESQWMSFCVCSVASTIFDQKISALLLHSFWEQLTSDRKGKRAISNWEEGFMSLNATHLPMHFSITRLLKLDHYLKLDFPSKCRQFTIKKFKIYVRKLQIMQSCVFVLCLHSPESKVKMGEKSSMIFEGTLRMNMLRASKWAPTWNIWAKN